MRPYVLPRPFIHAKRYAKTSKFHRIHMGCVAIYHGTILAYGINSHKSSPIQKKFNKFRHFRTEDAPHSLHAELHCLSKIKYLDIDWSKMRLYIYREKCDGSLGMARPCLACMAAIKEKGIKKIYYTTDNGYALEYIDKKGKREYNYRDKKRREEINNELCKNTN